MLIQESKILITGAAGSIGSALAMRLYQKKPKELTLVDQDETGIFYISGLMRGAHCLVGDITNKDSMAKIIGTRVPDIIFHCAAYKHVPIMELQREEAIKNNVYGTKNMIELAREYGSKKFVFLSTDKAVNPSSVMGKTKRICEQLCLSQDSDCDYIIVRFGNVIRSRGSVMEIFEKNIKEGKPVEITHPDMERYFITMQDAVNLLLEACNGTNRQLFIWNMGKPKSIVELANAIAKENKTKVKIKYVGLRPGEKLSEEISYPEEHLIDHGSYSVADLHYQSINLEELIKLI